MRAFLMANKTKHRGAFTLLELLIVVSIIVILTTMSVVVMANITEQANEEATVATIRKINGLLEARIEAFDRAFGQRSSFYNRYVAATNALLIQKNIYGVRPEVIDVLAKKVAFRHNFPQRHEDLLKLSFGADGVTPLTAFDASDSPISSPLDSNGNRIVDIVDASAISTAGNPWTGTDSPNDETVGAELLYWFLTSSGGLSQAVAADRFTESEVADTDDDGLLEFVDAWGNPLRFYRWPTRMIDYDAPVTFAPDLLDLADPTDTRVITVEERKFANILMKGLPPEPTTLPNGVIPRDMLLTDPDDPVGRIYAEMERLDGTNGKPLLASEYNAVWYHTPETYHTPLIVSAGTDEELGLFEPSDTPNGGHLASVVDPADLSPLLDNLTNRNRRAGGRR